MKKLIIICWLFLLLTGCITDMVQNPDTTIEKDQSDGYVAFSTVCMSDKPVFMYYEDSSYNFLRKLTARGRANIAIRCDTQQPQYVLLSLPKGLFNINGFGLSELSTKDFRRLSFTVLPGKIIYLGRFYIKANTRHAEFFENSNYGYLTSYVVDESKEDIAWFMQNYKNISRDSYVINVLNVNNAASIHMFY